MNASNIVGAVWSTAPPSNCPTGLEFTQGPGAKPPTYRTISHAAQREYADDDDGWQTVRERRGRRRRTAQ